MRQEARFVAAVVIVVFRGDRLLAMRRARTKDAAPGAWEALSGRLRSNGRGEPHVKPPLLPDRDPLRPRRPGAGGASARGHLFFCAWTRAPGAPPRCAERLRACRPAGGRS